MKEGFSCRLSGRTFLEEGFSPDPSPRTFTKGEDKSTQCYKSSFWFVRPRLETSFEASFPRWIANSLFELKVFQFHSLTNGFRQLVKVFARLFQKAAQSRARSPCRAPQSAKSPFGAFLFVSFFFCAYIAKRKSG